MKIFNSVYKFKINKKIILLITLISLYTISKIFITNHLYYKKKEIKNINIKKDLEYETNKIDNIIFINPKDAYEQIKNSGYINQFNKKDMEVRKCSDIESCEVLYENNLVEFSVDNKIELKRLIKLCNEKLKEYKSLYNIPWKLCKITTKLEDGMPHTHTDIIFLSETFFKKQNDNSKIVTLIHEKLHVYQRIYKNKTQKLYNNFNFSKVPKKNINLRRTNPDLDSFDYNYNGVLIYSEYQDDAKKLSDVDTKFISLETNKNKEIRQIENLAKQGYQNEHPNEIFASIISDKIAANELDKIFINYVN